MDVYNMTDEELSAELRNQGQDIGPIIDSTRKVYQRKLERLLRGEMWKRPEFDEGYGDYDDDDDIMDGPEIIPPAKYMQGHFAEDVRLRGKGEGTTKKTPYNTTYLDQSTTSYAAHTQAPAPAPASAPALEPTPTQQEKPQGGSSFWLQILILAIVAAVIFLILMNLEPSRQGRIGDIGE